MCEPNKTLLVVDDNPTNLNVLSNVLDDLGYEVLFAIDGPSAIERTKLVIPDLILLDVMMEGMDGFEVCRHLKDDPRLCDIPIIFMTALTDTKDKVRGFEAGAVDFITKPIQVEEVLARVRTHLKLKDLQQDLIAKNTELQTHLERERELNRLKNYFISMASHEFRTPLATILTTSSILKHYGHKLDESQRISHIEKIEISVQRMTTMLNDVLTLTKAESGCVQIKPEEFDVVAYCRTIIDDYISLSEGTHTIQFECESHIPVFIDRNLLYHILSNLISNAIKYSAAGSVVEFQVEQNSHDVIFNIKDRGIGISAEDLAHLYTPFHRGANVSSVQGTGLGLSIVKQFVDILQGRISVESQIDRGTTFRVAIPKVSPPVESMIQLINPIS